MQQQINHGLKDVTNYWRLLHVAQICYRKHVLGDEDIAWQELDEELANTLAECMGDRMFREWANAHTRKGKA